MSSIGRPGRPGSVKMWTRRTLGARVRRYVSISSSQIPFGSLMNAIRLDPSE